MEVKRELELTRLIALLSCVSILVLMEVKREPTELHQCLKRFAFQSLF